MRKTLFISIAILFFGCTKDMNSKPLNAGSINEIKTTSPTYLPLAKGDYWKYRITTDLMEPEKSKLTVLKLQKTINVKNYQAVKSVIDKNSEDTLYYAQDLHDYYLYTSTGTSDADKVNLEILFLKDNTSVGDSWLLPAGSAGGVSLKCYGKILEKDISITVSGTTYTHVIHSYVELRKSVFFTYVVVNKQDFYTAENIGIIKNINTIVLPNNSTTTTNITDYQVQ